MQKITYVPRELQHMEGPFSLKIQWQISQLSTYACVYSPQFASITTLDCELLVAIQTPRHVVKCFPRNATQLVGGQRATDDN